MKITKEVYPSEKGDITLFRLENSNGNVVRLSTLGAGIVEVSVPDRNGKKDNILLSYDNITDYIGDGPCMGKCPGRYANRIAYGHLIVGDKEYQLTVNCGPHHLHGGPEGFQNHNWEYRELPDGVEFSYISAAGEENYPGELKVKVTYIWDDDNNLRLDFKAETDADTVVNLTNHAYWNLDGAGAGKIFDHELRIKAGKWLSTDSTLRPVGVLAAVGGSPMDFRMFKRLGEDLNRDYLPLKNGKGYDHCWAFDYWKPGVMIKNAVELRSIKSGRVMRVSTDQPGVQVYTGNWLTGSPAGVNGYEMEDYDAVAIEAQGFPDAPNNPNFPSQLLSPGETYHRRIIYSFD